tara:strand:+ start:566 stop:700 length:135 start_codon:yes stop_codon:yes gene_type:complete
MDVLSLPLVVAGDAAAAAARGPFVEAAETDAASAWSQAMDAGEA